MNKEKTLLVIEPNDIEDIFFKDWFSYGYKAEVLFKRVSKPFRAVRRVFLRKHLLGSTVWLGSWYRELDQYEVLILHMSRLTRFLPEDISKKYPHLRIICWYRNPITEDNKPIITNNPKIEYWSFDGKDCEKYGLRQNIQYYCSSEIERIEKDVDVYFVGYEKGREQQIQDFLKIANESSLTCLFHVVSKDDKGFIPYSQVKKEINRTRAILEINQKNQVGYTLRTMESLFYGIKLITNNPQIKKSPFYNKNNIFILGEDSYEDLNKFIRSEYDHSVDAYQRSYHLDTWFKNFFV